MNLKQIKEILEEWDESDACLYHCYLHILFNGGKREFGGYTFERVDDKSIDGDKHREAVVQITKDNERVYLQRAISTEPSFVGSINMDVDMTEVEPDGNDPKTFKEKK